MSNADLYTRINDLRTAAVRTAYEAGTLSPDFTLDEHLRAIHPLTADSWHEDEISGRTLGNPNADWCVDIVDGDLVRVFADGDIVAEAVIDGAGSL
ncbi:MAG: hypothetical protein IPJ61_17490 [Tessaracoccus sp.]|uniref:hypothetical protein n=1 Tax=Tessaracoccus sp. TaxID=1971211 RepID=UPI001EBF2788|nr:hypothetical protein [Tessaracoccus sp.]MBK7822800.1 hypothetical protein [Tessaracoccus sp.]